MWNENTSIYEPEVVKIKNLLIRQGIVSESAFELKKNFDMTSGEAIYPVILLIDFSGSLISVREQLNRATRNFVRTVLESKGVLTKRIDFATVTFASEVKVRRSFGYITEEDLNESCEIRNDEMGGMTSMASGLFVAWYLAEARKQMYKDARVEYKQPVFVLMTDLCNNERTSFDGEYLVQKMVDLFNAKTEAKKLGLVKMLLGQVDQSYNEHLKGIVVGKPEEFAESLQKFFHELLATVAYQKDKEENYDSDEDEKDDGAFQVYGTSSEQKGRPNDVSGLFIELNKLYDED